MKLLVVLVGLFLIGYFLYRYALDSPYRITSAEARRRLKEGEVDLVLDVRTAAERSTLGFYPGSVHIPGAEIAARMPVEYPDRGLKILVYCNTGQRARAVTEHLHQLGYANSVYIASSHLSLM